MPSQSKKKDAAAPAAADGDGDGDDDDRVQIIIIPRKNYLAKRHNQDEIIILGILPKHHTYLICI